jgi:16S rRNA (guanine966-N2)-methyltransferase
MPHLISILFTDHSLLYICSPTGASFATFVDLSPECIRTAIDNAQLCGFAEQVNGCCAPAESVFASPGRYGLQGAYDLVSVTPPYEEVDYPRLIAALCASPLLASGSVVVLEYPAEMGSLQYVLGEDKLFGLRNRRYGRTVLAVYVYRPRSQVDLRPEEFLSIK